MIKQNFQQNETLYLAIKWQKWCFTENRYSDKKLITYFRLHATDVMFVISKASYLHAPLAGKRS